MKGDWISGDSAITAYLEQPGRSGAPLYLWYAPGETEPEVLSQIIAANVLPTLANKSG